MTPQYLREWTQLVLTNAIYFKGKWLHQFRPVNTKPAPPPVFRADHPFQFLIQENSTASILFMGRVANPTQRRQ